MLLETERLILVSFEATQSMAEEVYEYAKHPDVGPNAGWKPHSSPEESLEIIKTIFMQADSFAIRLKDTGKLIGSIGLEKDIRRPTCSSMEIGYSLAFEQWGRGYMTEAARAVVDYGFVAYDLEIMSAVINKDNTRSQAVIKKCGFKYEGTARRAFTSFDGTKRDLQCYSLLWEEWTNDAGSARLR